MIKGYFRGVSHLKYGQRVFNGYFTSHIWSRGISGVFHISYMVKGYFTSHIWSNHLIWFLLGTQLLISGRHPSIFSVFSFVTLISTLLSAPAFKLCPLSSLFFPRLYLFYNFVLFQLCLFPFPSKPSLPFQMATDIVHI